MYCTVYIHCMYVEKVKMYFKCIYCSVAVRSVAAGHKMIAEGWEMFEVAVDEVRAGELPQLLRSLKGMTTPPPETPPTPPPMDVDEASRKETLSPSPVKKKLGRERGRIQY